MTRLALPQAFPALFAIIHMALGKPLMPWDLARRQNAAWPATVSGEVYNSNWANFSEAIERWSIYKAPTFNSVFLPETEQDLSLGLQYLSSNGLPFLAKNGGHGYSITLESIQNATQINLKNFNHVNMQDDLTVVVGTGALFQDLINGVGAVGRELTVGACGCVGSTGAMLGGGLGRLQGLHGLTSDSVRNVRLALWNGTIIDASEEVNQDLFYGVRGLGQNYGIIIETTYETYPATSGGNYYNADMIFNKSATEGIMNVINNFATPALDPKAGFITFFALNTTTSELELIVNLVYAGTTEEGQQFSAAFSNLYESISESVLTWEELPTKSVFGLITAACTEGPRYNLYSSITSTLDPATLVEFADEFESFLLSEPLVAGSALMIETFPVQALEALPEDYSAFPHRKNFRNHIESIGSYQDDSVADAVNNFFLEWRDQFSSPAVSGYDQLYFYQNYAHGDESLSALYGYPEWRHERLTALKNKYDPNGLFNGYHAVPFSLADWS